MNDSFDKACLIRDIVEEVKMNIIRNMLNSVEAYNGDFVVHSRHIFNIDDAVALVADFKLRDSVIDIIVEGRM